MKKSVKPILLALILQVMLFGCNPTKTALDALESAEEEPPFLENEGSSDSTDYSIFIEMCVVEMLNGQTISYEIVDPRELPSGLVSGISYKDVRNVLRESTSNWLEKCTLELENTCFEITCHSPRYLSVRNDFICPGNRVRYIRDYITVDMQTGKRVMLDDLIDVGSPDLIHYLRTAQFLKTATQKTGSEFADFGSEVVQEWFNKFTDEQLQKMIYDACTDLSSCIMEGKSADVLERTTFNLENGRLVLIFPDGRIIVLDLNDIEQFLKVPKW